MCHLYKYPNATDQSFSEREGVPQFIARGCAGKVGWTLLLSVFPFLLRDAFCLFWLVQTEQWFGTTHLEAKYHTACCFHLWGVRERETEMERGRASSSFWGWGLGLCTCHSFLPFSRSHASSPDTRLWNRLTRTSQHMKYLFIIGQLAYQDTVFKKLCCKAVILERSAW